MNLAVQQVLVGLLVAAGIAFSAWRLLSARWRLRLLDALCALPGAGGAAWPARLRQRLLAQSTLACGGCANADAAHPVKPGEVSRNQTPGALRR
jgi:hypothetical protein